MLTPDYIVVRVPLEDGNAVVIHVAPDDGREVRCFRVVRNRAGRQYSRWWPCSALGLDRPTVGRAIAAIAARGIDAIGPARF